MLVIVPLMLVIVGGIYLMGVWTMSLQRAANTAMPRSNALSRLRGVRAVRLTELSGVDARDGGFDVNIVLGLLAKADPGRCDGLQNVRRMP